MLKKPKFDSSKLNELYSHKAGGEEILRDNEDEEEESKNLLKK